MYGWPGAKPRKYTRCTVPACRRTTSSGGRPTRAATASRSGPYSPPYTVGTWRSRPARRGAAGSAASASRTAAVTAS